MNYWCGVGSRDVPGDIQELQKDIGSRLARLGWTLRSGNARGSDISFQRGVYAVDPSLAEVWLPWDSFNNPLAWPIEVKFKVPTKRMFKEAHEGLKLTGVMPYIDNISDTNKKFHGRNYYQVLGTNGVLPKVCVYYAPIDKHGEVTGGTRTAVGLCEAKGIPTFNLKDEEEMEEFLKKLYLLETQDKYNVLKMQKEIDV